MTAIVQIATLAEHKALGSHHQADSGVFEQLA